MSRSEQERRRMRRYRFDAQRLASTVSLFPRTIANNLWVAFHGTDLRNADSIEATGFVPTASIVSLEDALRVARVYEAMDWFGTREGGYVALRSFSLNVDWKIPGSSPIYFAEVDTRAILHASRDFSGGEKVMGVLRSILDLQRYAESHEIRRKHSELQVRRQEDGVIAEWKSVDLEWLSAELVALNEIYSRCNELQRTFSGGVVYAVEFGERDLPRMSYSRNGIASLNTIPADRIIAKVELPPDLVEPWADNSRRIVKMLTANSGIFAALRRREVQDSESDKSEP
jgi:hypothetical protein